MTAKDDARKAKKLGEATEKELAAELWDREDVNDEWIANYFALDLKYDDDPDPVYDHEREIAEIYDAVAAGRQTEALRLLYEVFSPHVKLLHPNSQMRLAK